MKEMAIYAHSERLTLRHLNVASDTAAIQTYLSDFEISKWTAAIPHPLPDDYAQEYISRSSDAPTQTHRFMFAVVENVTQMLIGIVAYWPIDDDTDGKQLEISYWIGKVGWHRGYATEAVRMMLDYLYDANVVDDDVSFVALYQIDNVASIRVLEKVGFRHNGAPVSMGECLSRGRQVAFSSMQFSRRDDCRRMKLTAPVEFV